MARIDLQGVSHSYGSVEALERFDLTWEDGGRYAILGPSGCGKTTMLNIMSGIIQPTRGRILFDGQDVTNLATAQRNIAQVFQFPVILIMLCMSGLMRLQTTSLLWDTQMPLTKLNTINSGRLLLPLVM